MAILLSTNKPWTDLILCRKKRIEWRKSPLPKGLCYLYETKGKGGCGAVVGKCYIRGNIDYTNTDILDINYQVLTDGMVKSGDLEQYKNNGKLFANIVTDAYRFPQPIALAEFTKCVEPKMPYCPACKHGYVYIPETEYEDALAGNWYRTEWICCNRLKRPPQSWCYINSRNEDLHIDENC